ncbi:hypothetical protein F4808DRAFT_259017 [Astrocystis sublimbata]|nr:hypothetical protein F4808DRAFT_259017 [Astrocystis sublimbata]
MSWEVLHRAIQGDMVYPRWFQDLATDESRFRDAADVLLKYSLIETANPSHYKVNSKLHSLGSCVPLDRDDRLESIGLAVVVIKGLMSDNVRDTRDWANTRGLFEHIRNWASRILAEGDGFLESVKHRNANFGKFILSGAHEFAIVCGVHGSPKLAQGLYEFALAGRLQVDGRQCESTTHILINPGAQLCSNPHTVNEGISMPKEALNASVPYNLLALEVQHKLNTAHLKLAHQQAAHHEAVHDLREHEHGFI